MKPITARTILGRARCQSPWEAHLQREDLAPLVDDHRAHAHRVRGVAGQHVLGVVDPAVQHDAVGLGVVEVEAWGNQVLSARGVKRVERHSEYAI